jgi:citrate synthase
MLTTCTSDGKLGTFRYREVPVEDLFRKAVHEDVMHLILWGHMPSGQMKDDFSDAKSAAAVPP